jgi:hypothetical protein
MKIKCHIIGARLGDKVGWVIRLDEDCKIGRKNDVFTVSEAKRGENGEYEIKE